MYVTAPDSVGSVIGEKASQELLTPQSKELMRSSVRKSERSCGKVSFKSVPDAFWRIPTYREHTSYSLTHLFPYHHTPSPITHPIFTYLRLIHR